MRQSYLVRWWTSAKPVPQRGKFLGLGFMPVSEDWSSWAFKPRSASPAAATKETATAPAAAPAPAPATAAAATAPAPAPALRLELNPKR